jgi:DNA-binding CsgD family transcriptional regulator
MRSGGTVPTTTILPPTLAGAAPLVHDPLVHDPVELARTFRPGADEPETDVYHYAVRHGVIDSFDTAAAELGLPAAELFSTITRLVELRLLRTDSGAGDRLVPVDPETAAGLLVTPIERSMYEQRGLADRLRDRIDAITRPPAGPAAPVGAIDSLEGANEIRGLFKLASETCRDEVLIQRPSHPDEDLLDDLLDPCYAALGLGVGVRVVCPHRSRAGFDSRAKAKRLIEDGAEIRTLSYLPQAAVVFDRSLTVMISLPDSGEPSARLIRDREVVRYLVELFNQLWDGAAPFTTVEPGYADVTDSLQQSIARLMAEGLTDDVVARRLGMSVRTCRRHIAALLRNLDSVSRFQAGVHAAAQLTIGTPAT